MILQILSWVFGLALINFILFIVCFFWLEIRNGLRTPQGIFLSGLLVVCLVAPFAIIRYAEYRKKEELRKQIQLHRMRQSVEAQQRKEIGLDF